MKTSITLITAALALCGNDGGAATLAAWDMSGQPGDQAAMLATASAPGIDLASLGRGAGLSASSGADAFSSVGWGGSDPGDYIAFTLNFGEGYTAELDALLLGTRSSNTGPGSIGLYSSLDGFASPIDTLLQPGGTVVDAAFDLSALGAISGSIEFRLMELGDTQADGSGATSDAGTFRILDYSTGSTQFTGELYVQPVPLPATLWLFGSALGAVGVLRRRRDGA